MPELPEVETTVSFLKKKVLGRAFLDVWTDAPALIKSPASFNKFKKELKGKKIKGILRAGKNIIFELSGNKSLLIHQKLTGHLLYGQWKKEKGKWFPLVGGAIAEDPMNRFLHLIFWLDNGRQIALSDVRKFAKVELKENPILKKELSKIGPDALEVSFEEFKKILKKKKGKIKQVLMDQEVIAGIGNIYSDEILFLSKIHPARIVPKLSEEELKAIYRNMRKVLQKAVELQGTSVVDYRTPLGEKGQYEKLLKVYRKEGKPCPVCGAPIKRIKMGSRSAHFCPVCQK
jgi:formamidopyrimidine-DNA glycosylase